MFCEKYGGELRQEKNKLVCQKCGAQYGLDYSEGYNADYSVGGERVAPRGFSSKKNIIIIVIAALVVLGGIGAAVAFGVSHSASQGGGGFQLAEKYLSEQNYEQAIIAFEQVLEIEPMNVDAYLGLANAYIGAGDTDKALEVLRKGLEMTGDARLQAKIDELTKPVEPPASSSTASTSSEPVESDPAASEDMYSAMREYDAENRLIREVITDGDGITTENQYGELYDYQGSLTGWGLISTFKYRDHCPDEIFISDCEDNYGHRYETFYDDKGELLKVIDTGTYIIYGENGDQTYGGTYSDVSTYVNEYGEYGLVRATRTTIHSENGGETSTDVDEYLYEYDAKGRRISLTTDGELRHEWKYNDEDGTIEEHTYSYRSGQAYRTSVNIRKYDENGRLIFSEFTNTDIPSGEILHRYIHTVEYDESGKRVGYVNRNFDKDYRSGVQTEEISVTKFTDTGREEHYTKTRDDVTVEEYTHTFTQETDEFGRVTVETELAEDGSFAGKTVYEY